MFIVHTDEESEDDMTPGDFTAQDENLKAQ